MDIPSYVHGAATQPLIGETIGRYFDAVCARHADHEALVVRHQGVRLTYGELKGQVDALACGLLRLGLRPGDRIGLWSQNNVEWVLTQLAAAKAGLILVNLNPAYRRRELEYALRKAGCRALILAPQFKSSCYLDIIASVVPELALAGASPGRLRSTALPQLQWVIRLGEERTPGMLNLGDLMIGATSAELGALAEIGASLQFDDAANIQLRPERRVAPKARHFPTTTY